MRRDQLADLSAFAVVAEERSFTRAAIRLGVSPSALSHSLKALETRLGVRLLTRTTRSVAPTEAGEQLLDTVVPAIGNIDAALGRLMESREVPAGTVRLTAVKHAARLLLGPTLPAFLQRYPDITVEVSAEDQLRDLVADGFDAGIRLGEQVAKDMVSVRISEGIPTAVVAAPLYFEQHPIPVSPDELVAHNCICHRMGTGALHPWPFQNQGREFLVKVSGQTVFNDADLILDAALNGSGLAYVFADQVQDHCRSGRLVSVLDDWTTVHSGYFLHYVSRRQQPAALAALLDWLRNQRGSLHESEFYVR